MTVLQGKGFFIWRVDYAEAGETDRIVQRAKDAGLSHVLLKIADGKAEFGYGREDKRDLVAPVVDALKAAGIQAWGWHYVYGADPVGEARVAIRRVKALDLDGYVIDAEREYKGSGRAEAARAFMTALRKDLKYTPVALSSYRFPSYHQELPWAAFLEKCDLNMPQVYWEQSHNPAQQLRRTLAEFRNRAIVEFVRPVIPTGAAYGTGNWAATPGDIVEFLQETQSQNLMGANFYSWDWATSKGNTALWDAVADYDWPAPAQPSSERPAESSAPLLATMLEALNNHDFGKLSTLYHSNAAHVNPTRTASGIAQIRRWYESLFHTHLRNGAFNIFNIRVRGHVLTYNWNANSANRRFLNGADTLHLRDGKIQYHYTNFRPI